MASNNLNPRKLIPAMMRYSSEPHAKYWSYHIFLFNHSYLLWILNDFLQQLCATCRNETHEVIKYLEFCVHRLHNEDPGIHNLLLSLYAKQVELVGLEFRSFTPLSLQWLVHEGACQEIKNLLGPSSNNLSFQFEWFLKDLTYNDFKLCLICSI